MIYEVKEGLVLRNIAGIYFVIDIHDKYFYRNRNIDRLNEIAYAILSSIVGRKQFTVEDITIELETKLDPNTKVKHEEILSDVNNFVKELINKEWIHKCEMKN
ncbi:MAG: PqqD family protein [Synergistaceae bacterium]|nr:PqqD family protein [Synergistaceae bacterium]